MNDKLWLDDLKYENDHLCAEFHADADGDIRPLYISVTEHFAGYERRCSVGLTIEQATLLREWLSDCLSQTPEARGESAP
jgi:hypothetical protein